MQTLLAPSAAIHSRSSPPIWADVGLSDQVAPPSVLVLTSTSARLRLATYTLKNPAEFLLGAVARSVSPPPGAKSVSPALERMFGDARLE